MSIVTEEQRKHARAVNDQATMLNTHIARAVKAGLYVDVGTIMHREHGKGELLVTPLIQIQVYEKEVL